LIGIIKYCKINKLIKKFAKIFTVTLNAGNKLLQFGKYPYLKNLFLSAL